MAQTIEIDGQTYRVWYMHRHYNVLFSAGQDVDIMNAIDDALELGQLKQHEIKGDPDILGVTLCQLEDEDRNVVAKGYSFCSEKDNFNKKIGRAISLGRAKKALGECAPVVDGGLSKTSDTSSE